MRTLRVSAVDPEPEAIAEAAAVLAGGGLVAFPTETVYGLGAHAFDRAAVARIFAAKQRPSFNPLIVHTPAEETARELSAAWPETAARLAGRFWPGPLTLVVRKVPSVPDEVTAGLPTVALRVPAHPVAQALLRRVGIPVAAPSANPFTALSPTTARHVEKGLEGRIDLLLDAGPTAVGIESTVVDVSGDAPSLLRPGSIPLEELESVAGRFVAVRTPEGDAPRPAPGMVGRHYSPRARVHLVPAGDRARIEEESARWAASGLLLGALALHPPPPAVRHPIAMPADPESYARELYSALHRLDDLGCDVILVDAPPLGPAWAGVHDRISRAAHAD